VFDGVLIGGKRRNGALIGGKRGMGH
jgi:hypothetical protein